MILHAAARSVPSWWPLQSVKRHMLSRRPLLLGSCSGAFLTDTTQERRADNLSNIRAASRMQLLGPQAD